MVNIGTLMLAKPAPPWDDETLRTAEHELARALGPMAKLIVRRAAAQTLDRSELCAILSDTISDPESRRRFVAAFNRAGGGQSSTGASGVRSGTGARRRAHDRAGNEDGHRRDAAGSRVRRRR